MNEEWKDIIGYEGLYQVSNFGRVKSLPKRWMCGHNTIRKKLETIFELKPNKRGYIYIRLSNKDKKMVLVHQLVAIHFIPNPQNRTEINHIDGCKINNHFTNLEWSTRSENMLHAYRTGLYD